MIVFLVFLAIGALLWTLWNFPDIRIKHKITIKILPSVEFYERTCPIINDRDCKIFQSKVDGIKCGIDNVRHHLFNHILDCEYCKSGVIYWKENPKIGLFLRRITIYKDVPYGAKDKRIIIHKGWLAHITYSGLKTKCPQCGLGLVLKEGAWGLLRPPYGGTADLLVDTDSGYAVVKSSLVTHRWGRKSFK